MVWLTSLFRKLWPFSGPKTLAPPTVAVVGAPAREAVAAEPAPPPPPPPPPPAEPAVEATADAAPELPGNPYAPLVGAADIVADQDEDEDEDEDAASSDDDGDEPLDDEEIGPDPFVKATAAPVVPLAERELASERTAARAEALAGEHRIYISTVAGPGSLAEALNTLLTEGLVTAQFFDEGLEASFTVYTPLSPNG